MDDFAEADDIDAILLDSLSDDDNDQPATSSNNAVVVDDNKPPPPPTDEISSQNEMLLFNSGELDNDNGNDNGGRRSTSAMRLSSGAMPADSSTLSSAAVGIIDCSNDEVRYRSISRYEVSEFRALCDLSCCVFVGSLCFFRLSLFVLLVVAYIVVCIFFVH